MAKITPKIYSVTNSFIRSFQKDDTVTMAASIAFYTTLSLAPTLVLFVAVTSRFSFNFQQIFLSEAYKLIGEEGAGALYLVIESAQKRSELSGIAGIFGFATLLLSSSFAFGELSFALNKIFKCTPAQEANGVWNNIFEFLKIRLLHILLALSFICILTLSLMVSTFISSPFSDKNYFNLVANIGISLMLYSVFFTAMFRYAPFPLVPWRESILGGVLTSFLFVFGKETISIYLGNNAIGSAYGAAGSVIVFMAWIYYSALITLCGAHLSAILSRRRR